MSSLSTSSASNHTEPPSGARAPGDPWRAGMTRLVPRIGVGLVALGTVLVLLLHVLPPSNQVNPLTRTISEYALGANSWIFDLGLLALAAGSGAIGVGLVRGGVLRAGGAAAVFGAFWTGGLVVLVLFEKYDFEHGVTTGASGAIHRLASLVAFLSLPIAAVLTLRAAQLAQRDQPRLAWRRAARWTRWAAFASWACLCPLFYAFAVRAVTGFPWWKVFPIGALERLIALSDIGTLFALGYWACRAVRPSGSATDPVGDGSGRTPLVQ